MPSSTVVATDPRRPWDPTSLEAIGGPSYVDFQFSGGGSSKPLRLLANGDTRLYGELIMEEGLLRSYGGFGFTSYDTAGPLASFRQGAGIGTEVLRINTDGSIQSRSGGSLQLMAEVPTGGTTAFSLASGNDVASGKSALEISELGGTILTLSGRSTPAGGKAVLRGFGENGFQVLAEDTDFQNPFTNLELAGSSVSVLCASGGVGPLSTWGTLDISLGGVATLDTARRLVITANDSGTYKDFDVVASDINLTIRGGEFRVKDASGTTRFTLHEGGNLTVFSQSSDSADLVLDSTASSGSAKSWMVRSDYSTGKLRLMNLTDTVNVDITTDGSVYSPAYMGVQVVSSAPTTSTPPSGAFVAYASGGTYRWYVHFGGGTWKRVDLVT